MTPRVRAVILNYNGGRHVLDAVAALLDTKWPSDRFEVVVVDNASNDGSDREIEQRFPTVRLIRSPSNMGFPGNNLGLRSLDGIDYVALVNNDAFVSPDWLDPLVAALAADAQLGAVCPKILFAPVFVDVVVETPAFRVDGDTRDLGVRVSGIEVDGCDTFRETQFGDGFSGPEHGPADEPTFAWSTARGTIRVPLPPGDPGPFHVRLRIAGEREKAIALTSGATVANATVSSRPDWIALEVGGPGYDVINNVGSVLTELGFGADRGYLERDHGQYDEPAEVFAWCGGGVLLRSEYLREVGLFDETFFLYYEDTDLAWRGRAQGWRYRYVPESVVRHIHAASTGESSPIFQHYVERNRLVMLLKNAPWKLVAKAVYRYLRMVASFTLRLIVAPIVRRRRPSPQLPLRRIRSFGGFLRLAPSALRERRTLRRLQIVSDKELLGWMVPR